MKLTWPDFWRPTGTVDRATYAVVGLVGFALKHNLDRLVASHGFHRGWSPFSYWVPLGEVARVTALRADDARFLATMVALALPFIWIGVILTMQRLRNARLPLPLVVLFFIPFLNLLFFLFLCLFPERNLANTVVSEPRNSSPLARVIPEDALGSAALSLLFTVPIGLLMVWLGVHVFLNYGWGVFVAVPFTMGFAAALVYGVRQPRSLRGCIGVACLAVCVLGLALLAVAVEGIVCLFMAMPVALPLALLGGVCGYFVQRRRWFPTGAPAFLAMLLIFTPGVQWTEHILAARPQIFIVRSAIDIDAPPQRVWQQVVAFSQIPAPTEWIFRSGVAYPIRAEMIGSGAGAERHCVFSTGAFVEPIEIWDEPHRLKFSVTSNPPPMEEWSPYARIEPPHLHGFLVSEGGQFLLTALPDGGTRLEGTTWYRHGLWPAQYWRLWSDAIIHRIHMRVLRHIKHEVENSSH